MNKQVIYFYNSQLGRVHPVFSTIHPGWSQKVEVVYTDDKTDKIWNGAAAGAGGVTFSASVCKDVKSLNALIAIDLSLFVKPKLTSSLMHSKSATVIKPVPIFEMPALNVVKKDIFTTVVHELLHVLQGWIYGDEWHSQYDSARLEAFGKDVLREFKLMRKGQQPYYGYKNRYELASFRFGTEWVKKNERAIENGNYDDLIPVPLINSLLQNKK